jgi:hypothetical protein
MYTEILLSQKNVYRKFKCIQDFQKMYTIFLKCKGLGPVVKTPCRLLIEPTYVTNNDHDKIDSGCSPDAVRIQCNSICGYNTGACNPIQIQVTYDLRAMDPEGSDHHDKRPMMSRLLDKRFCVDFQKRNHDNGGKTCQHCVPRLVAIYDHVDVESNQLCCIPLLGMWTRTYPINIRSPRTRRCNIRKSHLEVELGGWRTIPVREREFFVDSVRPTIDRELRTGSQYFPTWFGKLEVDLDTNTNVADGKVLTTSCESPVPSSPRALYHHHECYHRAHDDNHHHHHHCYH